MIDIKNPNCLDSVVTSLSAIAAIASPAVSAPLNLLSAGVSVAATALAIKKDDTPKLKQGLTQFNDEYGKFWRKQSVCENVDSGEVESAIASFEQYFNSDDPDLLPSPEEIVALGINADRITEKMLQRAAEKLPGLYGADNTLTDFTRKFFISSVTGGLNILFSDPEFSQSMVPAVHRVITDTHQKVTEIHSAVKEIADKQITAEQVDEILTNRLKEVESARSTADAHELEKLSVEFEEINKQLEDKEQSYRNVVETLGNANQALNEMANQIPSAQIEHARTELAHGPEEAFHAFEEIVSGGTGSAVAEAAYQAAVLAMSLVKLADAQKHFDIAVALDSENIPYLKDSGYLEYKYGSHEKSEELFEKALKLSQDENGEDNQTTAALRNDLGGIYNNMGEHADAIAQYELAVPVIEKHSGYNGYDTAIAIANLGDAYRAQGLYRKAFPILRDSMERCPTYLGALNLASAYIDVCAYEMSINVLTNIIHQLSSLNQNTVLDDFSVRSALLLAYVRNGDYPQSEELADELILQGTEIFGAKHPAVLNVRSNLALSYSEQNLHARSEKILRDIHPSLEESYGVNHIAVATNLHNLGENLRWQGNLKEAQEKIERGLSIRRVKLGDKHQDVASAYNSMGLIMKSHGHIGVARQYMEAAVQICTAAIGRNAEQTQIYLSNLNGLGYR